MIYRSVGRLIAAAAVGTALFAGCKDGASPANDALPSTPADDAGAPPSGAACLAPRATHPEGEAWSAPAEASTPIEATFTVTVDPKATSLDGDWREPQRDAVKVDGGGAGLRLVGGAKRFANVAGRLLVELVVVNDGEPGLRGAVAEIANVTGATAFHDLEEDPLADASAPGAIALGGIAPRGVSARLRVGLDADAGPVTMTVTVRGASTSRVSTSSAPIAASPDGKEIWAPFADAGVVGVVDTQADARVASVAIPGRPSSVAITPDGKLALVTTSACNQLVVVDRASRAIVQVLGEADGIGRDPRHVVVSPDGARAYVSAYVGDAVTALERVGDAFRVVKTVPVGRRPVGLSVTPDGATVLVAHFLPRGPLPDNEGWVSAIDASTLSVASEAPLRDDADEKEASCFARVAAFQGYDAKLLTFEAVPTQLSGVFLHPNGAVGLVPALRTAGFPVLEGNPEALGFPSTAKGANSPSMLFPLDARDPKHAAFRKTAAVVDFTDRDLDFLRCVPATDDSESVTVKKTSATEWQYPGVTIPSASSMLQEMGVARFVGWTPGGRRALVLSYLADELAVMDGATLGPVARTNLLLSGSNPIGLAITPDGKKAYVAYEDSTFVSVLDVSAYADPVALGNPTTVPYKLLPGDPSQGATVVTFATLAREVEGVPDAPPVKEIAQVPIVDADPMDPVLRRGKVLFTSSSPVKYPTLSGNREASCSACHPNGGNDGSAWSTMEGERRTIGLWGGTGKRGWLHASATHASSHEFATVIVRERLGGTGLSDADADALSRYVAKGIPEVQRPATDPALVARGKTLFDGRCAGCHGGPDMGSGAPDDAAPYGDGLASGPVLYDVGSASDWAKVTLSEAYTHLFPPKTKKVFDLLRGDRALGGSDPVQATLGFTPRPDRARGKLKASTLTNEWENTVFFHDARAASLDDAVRDIAQRTGAPLTDDEAKALVEYMKSL